MNQPLKQLLRIGGIVIGLGATVWALRDRLLPAPDIPDGPPPRFRTGADTTSDDGDAGSDLTAVRGIGPVYAERLKRNGITTYHDLASADPAVISEQIDVAEATVSGWIGQAAQLAQ